MACSVITFATLATGFTAMCCSALALAAIGLVLSDLRKPPFCSTPDQNLPG
jgi:hypothetical protein